jgi:hypothetical protein
MFDDNLIPRYLKENIALAYMRAALKFKIKFDTIASKIVFLYSSRSPMDAVLLARALVSVDYKCKYSLERCYYNKVLGEEVKCLYRTVNTLGNINEGQNMETTLTLIHDLLKNLHIALSNVPF